MKGRRGRGEGSIYRRGDGRYCASISLGYDANGKRKRRTVYGVTKQAVQEQLTRLQGRVLDGAMVEPTRTTVVQYLRTWLEDIARPALRLSTYVRYKSLIEQHIAPFVGGVRLAAFHPGAVQSLYAVLRREGRSARTGELVHTVLHSALRRAVLLRFLVANPCDAVEKPRAPKPPAAFWTLEHVRAFLEAARSDRLFALYLVAIATGMRQGCLFALQWLDIDLRRGVIEVQRAVVELKGKQYVGETKPGKGRRRIDLPALAVEVLREHRKKMLAEGHPGPWVFCDTDGGMLRRSNVVQRSFEPLIQKAGVPRIPFKGLRHTSATLLLRQNVHPKVVQERLGHSRVSITLDTYSHVLPSLQQEAATKLDELLQPEPKQIGCTLATSGEK